MPAAFPKILTHARDRPVRIAKGKAAESSSVSVRTPAPLVDGLAGAVWSVGSRVVGIELLGDPETLDVLDLEPVQE